MKLQELFAKSVELEPCSKSFSVRLEEPSEYWIKLAGLHKGCLVIKLDDFKLQGPIEKQFHKHIFSRCDYAILNMVDMQLIFIELKSGDLGNYKYQLLGGEFLVEMLLKRAQSFLEIEDFPSLCDFRRLYVVLAVQQKGRSRKQPSQVEVLQEGIRKLYVYDETSVHLRRIVTGTIR